MHDRRPIRASWVVASALLVAGCGHSGGHQATSKSTTSSSSSVATTSTTATGAATWLTYHRDLARTGNDPNEPAVSGVSRSWRSVLDGQVYAEPLVDQGHVFAATEHDTVYSLLATTGGVAWSTNLGTPMPGAALPCGNIDPSGVTGTPVIDPVAGVIWVVAFVQPGVHQLLSLSLADGRVLSRRAIALPGVNPLAEQQRGALTIEDGNVYAPFGGLYGDCGNYKGFVVSFSTAGSASQTTYAVPTAKEGAIWAPPGPVIDGQGNLLVATGNSASDHTYDKGDSVIRLSPTLQEEDSFAPSNWVQLNEGDLDLGSVAPTLVGGDLVFQIGKEGVGYLLKADHLGGVGGQLYSAKVCPSGAFGGTAVENSLVVVPCKEGLVAVQIGSAGSFSTLWSASLSAPGSPVIAAGMVWVVISSGHLVGLSEKTGKVVLTELVGSGTTSFPSLAIAGGQIFAQGGNAIVSFGGI